MRVTQLGVIETKVRVRARRRGEMREERGEGNRSGEMERGWEILHQIVRQIEPLVGRAGHGSQEGAGAAEHKGRREGAAAHGRLEGAIQGPGAADDLECSLGHVHGQRLRVPEAHLCQGSAARMTSRVLLVHRTRFGGRAWREGWASVKRAAVAKTCAWRAWPFRLRATQMLSLKAMPALALELN